MPRLRWVIQVNCCAGSRTGSIPKGRGVLEVWMSHGDKVTTLPTGFKTIVHDPLGADCRHGR